MADRPHPLAPPSRVTPAVLATVPPRKPGESAYDRILRVSAESRRWQARALDAEKKLRRREIAHRRLLRYVLRRIVVTEVSSWVWVREEDR